MASGDYFIDLTAKIIKLPSSRWYETPDGIYPSATTILSAKSKQGLTSWQTRLAMQGVDPKKEGRKAMDEGSRVHHGCEAILKGERLYFYDEESDKENYDLHNEWLPICRFKEAVKTLDIKPVLIEQTIWSKEHEFAGTLDLLCTLKPDPKKEERCLALVDLKRSAAAYIEYHWQVAAYCTALSEMAQTNELIKSKLQDTAGMRAFLLLLNVDTKKGWRLTEIENVAEKFGYFKACSTIWRGENPNFNAVQEQYPLELSLEEIK